MFETYPKTVGDMMTVVNKHADIEEAKWAHCRHKTKNDYLLAFLTLKRI